MKLALQPYFIKKLCKKGFFTVPEGAKRAAKILKT